MNRRFSGQNLTEFVIIVSLVSIVCILIYTLLGDQINQLFKSSHKKVENFKPFGVSFDSSGARKYNGGELGGTPAKPVKLCNNSSCTLDFGDFVLSGIPEDFNDYLKSNGAAGGTEVLYNLMNQIADTLSEQGKTNEANKIKDLANLGYFISSYEKQLESEVTNCTKQSDPKACVLALEPLRPPLAANITSLVPDYDPSSAYFLHQEGNDLMNPGTVGGDCNLVQYGSVSQADCDHARSSTVSGAFLSKYEEIMKDDGIPESARGVVENLYNEIGLLGGHLRFKSCIIQDTGGCNPVTSPVDPEKQIIYDALPYTGTINEIMSSYASQVSKLDSGLICAAGWKKATGSSCY